MEATVIDAPGDHVLAEFPDAMEAVACAVEIQKELKSRNDEVPEPRRMEFRFGIDRGEVVKKEGTIFGDGVNIAVRLQSFADAGGICVSGAVYEQIKDKSNTEIRLSWQAKCTEYKGPCSDIPGVARGRNGFVRTKVAKVRIKLLETVFYCHYHHCGFGWFSQRSLATLPETVPAHC